MRKILLALLLVAAAVAGGALLALRHEPRWTTDSEAALEAFDDGLEAIQKLYHDEARGHYQRAIELDPDFAAAKLYLLRVTDGRHDEGIRRDLIDELRTVDRQRLSEWERFLIEYQLERIDGDRDSARPLLERYLEEHPKDPFALDLHCGQVWESGRFAEASDCFRRLIEIDPNWVRAQNLLGYMAMAQGDFDEAEEQFEIYRYLAPDQANPHDSLGELLLLTGRWDEARREFEQALAVKPDFCASWGNLLRLALADADYPEARRLAARAAATGECGEGMEKLIGCHAAVWGPFRAGDWESTWETYQAQDCKDDLSEMTVIAFEAALRAGRREEALALRDQLEERHGESRDEMVQAFLLHLDGLRLRLEDKPRAAVETLRKADDRLAYWNAGTAFFKLANALELSRALHQAGEPQEAERVLTEARAVNAPLVERWLAAAPDGAD